MHALSVKELRSMLPVVRSELKKGTSFLIIYKSKPIATLKPVDDLPTVEELNDADVEAATLHDFSEDDDYVTPDELNYYLSLKSPTS